MTKRGPSFNSIQNNHPRVVLSQQEMTIQSSGPIPSPDVLMKYKEISADFPERILAMAEKEQENRVKQRNKDQELEQVLIRGNKNNTTLGIICATITMMLIIIGAVFCAKFGKEFAASFLGLGGAACVVTAFLNGAKNKKLEK